MTAPRSVVALLARELRLLGTGLAVAAPILLLQAFTFLAWGSPEGFAYLVYLAVVAIAAGLVGLVVDEHAGAQAQVAALPVERRVLVASRYVWCALVIAAVAGLAIVEERLFRGLAAGRGLSWPAAPLGAGHLALYLAGAALPMWAYLPFAFRWGAGAGAARFACAAGSLAVLAGVAGAAARLRLPAVAELLAAVTASRGAAARLAVTCAALAALGVTSHALSRRAFDRRDL